MIVPVHYAGVSCDMDKIMDIARRHNLLVVEDAAQAVDSYYKDRPLGGIGHIGCFSFHETKNITAGGEGGLLVINDEWVDTGSSFLPSEINAAFLLAQLENLSSIQSRRKEIWQKYYDGLKVLADKEVIQLPDMPQYASNNAHMFYIVCRSLDERTGLIKHLKDNGITAPFHYLSLHKSDFYKQHCGIEADLPYCDRFADCLVRLPMFYELTDEEVEKVIKSINGFFNAKE